MSSPTPTSGSFDLSEHSESFELVGEMGSLDLEDPIKAESTSNKTNNDEITVRTEGSQEAEEFIIFKSKAMKKQEHREAKEAALLEKAKAASAAKAVPTLAQPVVNGDGVTGEARNDMPEGPMIEIYVNGKDQVNDKPIREKVSVFALKAVSEYADKYFEMNPLAKQIHFLNCDKKAVSKIVAALEKNPTEFKIPRADDFIEGVKLYQASKAMDIKDEKYTKPILRFLRTSISRRLLNYSEIDSVLARVAVDDALFKHLVHNLAHLRFIKVIPDPEPFEAYLESRPTLKQAIQAVDDEKSALRKAQSQRQHAPGDTAGQPQGRSPGKSGITPKAKSVNKSNEEKARKIETGSQVKVKEPAKAKEPAKRKGDRFEAAFRSYMEKPVEINKGT
jgi:hypothetical protein